MYWISSQILCHMHTDTAEGEDFENQSKQEIMRGERVLHERTDWPVKQRISTWPQNPPQNLKQHYGLAFQGTLSKTWHD